MINCFYDCYRILNKVYSEKAFIKQAINETQIEEKNRALTVKICYGTLDTDYELSYYIKLLAPKSPKLVVRTILKISMYAIKFLGKKEYAVIDNAVSLTKKLGKSGASGFVNAFLRKFVKLKPEVPTDIKDYLSIKYSYPNFAVEELIKKYGKERTESILSAKNSKTTLAFYDVDGEEYLKNKALLYEKTPFNNVFSLNNFTRNQDYDNGVYTFQALGSIAICEVVEPCDNLLDCCSAPGGKTVRLSYKCKSVTALELHEHRVNLVKSYASRMKRQNIVAKKADAKVYNSEYDSVFDGVLVDAPCSGLGVVNDNPDIRLNREEKDVLSLLEEQINILNTACKYVKVGGYLYYSTCSILERENQLTIRKFLKTNPNFECQSIDSKLAHEKSDLGITFLPDISSGLGFYVCKLKRVR